MRSSWWQAKEAIRKGLGERLSGELGMAELLGRGMSYEAYHCEAVLDGEEADIVVRLPLVDGFRDVEELARIQVAAMAHLEAANPPFRFPNVYAVVEIDTGPALVEEMIYGMPLAQGTRWSGGSPWVLVAEAAAGCHGIDPTGLEAHLPEGRAYASRRAHAEARMAVCAEAAEELDSEGSRMAHDWCGRNLPPDEPPSLIHGDLLGQNIIRSFEPDEPPALIDWAEISIGDPAYDLAVVTRGAIKPFKRKDGALLLLEAYRERVPDRKVRASDIRFHELCLLCGFLLSQARSLGPEHPAVKALEEQLKSGLLKARNATTRRTRLDLDLRRSGQD